DGLPEEFDRVAQMEGTLVILMGLARLERIAQRLMAAGKPDTTPAAVLSGGNSQNPACVRGTLKTIAQAARAQQVQPPAIIVIGEVAAMELNP
ncbi:MAG: uroporphyrinogen-III C-methyltransferase, partial [Candidatus Ventricola sp.]|nr:uroporphyrinogen-III C-methyltransferase [Candidatus Ventricola sp.]